VRALEIRSPILTEEFVDIWFSTQDGRILSKYGFYCQQVLKISRDLVFRRVGENL
jgi:hypothetical protein